MTTARSRSYSSSHRTRVVRHHRPVRHSSPALILLARTVAGGVLVGAITTASRLMYAFRWETDGAIAVTFAAAWIIGAEFLLGGL
jgi:hypothetical protein